ncbi:uncharacterized protein JCM10292_003841 [Rhodotorula paludigena]|uniref:uncharacterized protein n=1 Tax=Rhodotorula paludigena TaxID=86838 RepID=UPI00317B46BC
MSPSASARPDASRQTSTTPLSPNTASLHKRLGELYRERAALLDVSNRPASAAGPVAGPSRTRDGGGVFEDQGDHPAKRVKFEEEDEDDDDSLVRVNGQALQDETPDIEADLERLRADHEHDRTCFDPTCPLRLYQTRDPLQCTRTARPAPSTKRRRRPSNPAHRTGRWLECEDDLLLWSCIRGEPWTTTAERLKRSLTACQQRWKKLKTDLDLEPWRDYVDRSGRWIGTQHAVDRILADQPSSPPYTGLTPSPERAARAARGRPPSPDAHEKRTPSPSPSPTPSPSPSPTPPPAPARWTELEEYRLVELRRQGLTFTEIGKVLGRSAGAAMGRFGRIRKMRIEALGQLFSRLAQKRPSCRAC